MARRAWQGLRAASLAGLLLAAPASAAPATAVQDLHYGEVLFHFYQDDYFGAITRLLAARQGDRFRHHADEAELLLGGLQLSYGLYADAEAVFQRLLKEPLPATVRNRAWYYLARMAYEKGEPEAAGRALEAVSGDLEPQVRGDRQILLALTRLARGDAAGAAAALQPWQGVAGDEPFARYNLGVALIRAGEAGRGTELLDALGGQKARGEDGWALRDKTNLALGYALLQQEQPAPARAVLGRVRKTGPFTDQALLGLGWAFTREGQHAAALGPLGLLVERPVSSPAAQEARLAVPYLYAQLGDRAEAARRYRAAIDAFEAEHAVLAKALAAVRDGELLAALDAEQPLPGATYLAGLSAGHRFREAVQTYRELRVLRDNLRDWTRTMGSFDAMLETRETRYREALPAVQSALAGLDPAELRARRDTLAAQVESAAAGDGLHLASAEETARWARLEAVRERVAALNGHPQQAELARRVALLQGLLRWDLDQAYPARRWEARKSLKGLDAELATLAERRTGLASAQAEAETRFGGYRARIEAERARVDELLPRTEALLVEQAARVAALATAELSGRQTRLEEQLSSARFALAALFDEAARGSGEAGR